MNNMSSLMPLRLFRASRELGCGDNKIAPSADMRCPLCTRRSTFAQPRQVRDDFVTILINGTKQRQRFVGQPLLHPRHFEIFRLPVLSLLEKVQR